MRRRDCRAMTRRDCSVINEAGLQRHERGGTGRNMLGWASEMGEGGETGRLSGRKRGGRVEVW